MARKFTTGNDPLFTREWTVLHNGVDSAHTYFGLTLVLLRQKYDPKGHFHLSFSWSIFLQQSFKVMNTVSYLKEKLLETMKKVIIQTYGSSLKTDKEKLLSSYLLYSVLHCLSEIKTPLFHTLASAI